MSYLLDKKIKQKKIINALLVVFVCLVLFYFRFGITQALSHVSQKIFVPVWVVAHNIGQKFAGVGSFLVSKNSLFLENQDLKSKLEIDRTLMENYNQILAENLSLKEILGRKNEKLQTTLGVILAKPNRSPYDTIVIDIGQKEGLKVGNMVFALGNIPIGRISDIYSNSSKVVLFSSSDEKTEVMVGHGSALVKSGKNIMMQVVGRGGGNFEMILPRDFTSQKGDQVFLPGIDNYLVATVEAVLSDPRDPFIKALLVSPVNVQELKFVQVGTSAE